MFTTRKLIWTEQEIFFRIIWVLEARKSTEAILTFSLHSSSFSDWLVMWFPAWTKSGKLPFSSSKEHWCVFLLSRSRVCSDLDQCRCFLSYRRSQCNINSLFPTIHACNCIMVFRNCFFFWWSYTKVSFSSILLGRIRPKCIQNFFWNIVSEVAMTQYVVVFLLV